MRDIFTEIFAGEPVDPTEAARRAVRPKLRARFYERAHVGEAPGREAGPAFPVLLDGRPVRTPAREPLAAPSQALAEAIAAEWDAQREAVDPARMPLTRLANAIIDGVARSPSFHGWYIQATWLLTGEEHPYRRKVPTTNPAVFDRPRPYENFFFVKTDEDGPWWRRLALGRGAWEVALRYCRVDLNDPAQGVHGQTYQDITLGLNWYLTINTKIQGNYIIADRNFPAAGNHGAAHILGVRFHLDY